MDVAVLAFLFCSIEKFLYPNNLDLGAVENGFIESFNGRLRDECLNL